MTPENSPNNPEVSKTFYKDIVRQTLPCWSEISWEESPPTFVIRIHKNVVNTISIKPETPIVSYFQESLQTDDFSRDLKENFGFEGVMKNRGETDDFYEYGIEIPEVKTITNNPCQCCGGSGKSDFAEMCLSCQGEGKEIEYDWRKGKQISASLYILESLFALYAQPPDSSLPQLLTFQLVPGPEYYGLGGKISIPLKEWLTTEANENHQARIETAIKAAYKKMYGQLTEIGGYYLRARIHSGKISIDCPGDACGIHPENWHVREGEGYEFTSHNVDSPTQQLTLLVGLASLHDIAREEIPLSSVKFSKKD